MCDADWGEQCEVWLEKEVKGRKQYRCCICGEPIFKGERHTYVKSLYDGHWDTNRAHLTCVALTKYIAFNVCNQNVWYMDADYDLRFNVREHMHEDPEVLKMYRSHLRERIRAGNAA